MQLRPHVSQLRGRHRLPACAVALRSPPRRGLRTRITSQNLCDDVLERLRPILQEHRGCNLIDVQPAGSLWSEKLCAALQPRSRIVVHNYGNTPSIETTKVKHDVRFKNLKGCLDTPTDVFSQVDQSARSGASFEKVDKSILMTANFTSNKISTTKFHGPAIQYVITDLYASMFRMGQDVFRHGLFRLLAWMPEDFDRVLVPRSVGTRSRFDVKFEAAFTATVIAGGKSSTILERHRRWPELDRENISALASATQITPNLRQDEPPLPIVTSIEPNPVALREARYTTDASFYGDWLSFDAQLRESDPDWFGSDGHPKKTNKRKAESPEKRQWRAYATRAKGLYTRYQKVDRAIGMFRDLDKDFRQLAAEKKWHGESRQDFWKRYRIADSFLTSLSSDGQITARKAIDDYRAYDASPKVLEWNRRTSEPLIGREDEFSGGGPLSLVLIEPKPGFRRLLDTDSKNICFDYILRRLTQRWAASVHEALESLLGSGVDEFVANVPSLVDPQRGGWYDLKNLRVRSLPVSTFLDIAIAYEQWPLRIDDAKMMMELGGDSSFVSSE